MGTSEITSLFFDWNKALTQQDAKFVASFYAPNAILLPTMSNQILKTPEKIEQYFSQFILNKPSASLIDSNIRILSNVAVHSGIYNFKLKNSKEVLARFSFVYQKFAKQWLIVEHHSSFMPEV